MSELKDKFAKIGFSEQENDEVLSQLSNDEAQNYAQLDVAELALKAKSLRSKYLSSAPKTKLKPKTNSTQVADDTTNTMVFKRASLPQASIGTDKATQTSTLNLDNLSSADDAVNAAPPSPKAPSPLQAPGSTLKKPSADIDEEEQMPTMAFKRGSLPGMSASLNQATQQNPAFKLSKPNKSGNKTTPPPETGQSKLNLPGANKKSALQPVTEKASLPSKNESPDNSSKSALRTPGSGLVKPKAADPASQIDLETLNTIQVNRSQVPGAAVELDAIQKKLDPKSITPPGGGLNFKSNKMIVPGGASKLPNDIPAPGTLLQESRLKTSAPGGASKAPGDIAPADNDMPNEAVPTKTIELKPSNKISAPGTTRPLDDADSNKSIDLDDRPKTSVRANIKKLKKKKKSASKLPVLAMLSLAGLVIVGLFVLNSGLFESDEVETATTKEQTKEKKPTSTIDKEVTKTAPKTTTPPAKGTTQPKENAKNAPVLPEQREWSLTMVNKVDFNLSEPLKDQWTTELWFSLQTLSSNKNINLFSINNNQVMLKIKPDGKLEMSAQEVLGTTDKGIRTFNTHYHMAITYKKGILELFINGKPQFQEQVDKLELKSLSLGSDLQPITYDEILISSSIKYPRSKDFIPQRTFVMADDTQLYLPVEVEEDKSLIFVYKPTDKIPYQIGSGQWENTAKQIMAVEELLLEIASPKIEKTTIR